MRLHDHKTEQQEKRIVSNEIIGYLCIDSIYHKVIKFKKGAGTYPDKRRAGFLLERMKDLGNYECDGQIEMTDYLKSKIKSGKVKDLTDWINSQGKAQYTQIGEIVKSAYEMYKDSDEVVGRITNAVSVYVLTQSMGYMDYLRNESE